MCQTRLRKRPHLQEWSRERYRDREAHHQVAAGLRSDRFAPLIQRAAFRVTSVGSLIQDDALAALDRPDDLVGAERKRALRRSLIQPVVFVLVTRSYDVG